MPSSAASNRTLRACGDGVEFVEGDGHGISSVLCVVARIACTASIELLGALRGGSDGRHLERDHEHVYRIGVGEPLERNPERLLRGRKRHRPGESHRSETRRCRKDFSCDVRHGAFGARSRARFGRKLASPARQKHDGEPRRQTLKRLLSTLPSPVGWAQFCPLRWLGSNFRGMRRKDGREPKTSKP